MKFEKFAKKVVPYCSTVLYNGQAYLKCGKTYAKIPLHVGQIGSIDQFDEILQAVLESEIYEEPAELCNAYLPSADGKSKDIVREYSDGELSFCISNENFGLIERYDQAYIVNVDDEKFHGTALLIGKPVTDVGNFEADLIFTDIKMEEK